MDDNTASISGDTVRSFAPQRERADELGVTRKPSLIFSHSVHYCSPTAIVRSHSFPDMPSALESHSCSRVSPFPLAQTLTTKAPPPSLLSTLKEVPRTGLMPRELLLLLLLDSRELATLVRVESTRGLVELVRFLVAWDSNGGTEEYADEYLVATNRTYRVE